VGRAWDMPGSPSDPSWDSSHSHVTDDNTGPVSKHLPEMTVSKWQRQSLDPGSLVLSLGF
jgi:hypothetical protein